MSLIQWIKFEFQKVAQSLKSLYCVKMQDFTCSNTNIYNDGGENMYQ